MEVHECAQIHGLGRISRPHLSRWQIRERFWQIRRTLALLHQGNSADLPKRNSVLANPPSQMTRAKDSCKPMDYRSIGHHEMPENPCAGTVCTFFGRHNLTGLLRNVLSQHFPEHLPRWPRSVQTPDGSDGEFTNIRRKSVQGNPPSLRVRPPRKTKTQ